MAKKRKKKSNGIKTLFVIIAILVIIGVLGFLGFKSYKELEGIKDVYDSIDIKLPSTTSSDLTLPTKLNEDIKIVWESSNKNVISTTGKVTQPDFEEGSVDVILTGKVEITFHEVLSSTLSKFVLTNIKDFVYTVKVEAGKATPSIKVQKVYDRLSMIEETYDSINLPDKACFDDINITWISLNPSIITNDGQVTTPSSDSIITLVATISCEDYSRDKEFKIVILSSEKLINVVNDNFDDQAPTSTYKTITSTNGVVYNNARIIEESEETRSDETDDLNKTTPSYIKLRNKDDSNGETLDDNNIGSFIIENIENPKLFKFDYLFSGTQAKEDSKLVIIFINLLTNEETKEEIIVKHVSEYTHYEKDLTSYEKITIKVKHIDTWKTDTFINIDNVSVDKGITMEMVKEAILNNFPTTLSNSIVLPFTSIYGGSVVWESSSTSFTNYGSVEKKDDAQKVTLTGNINYLGMKATITIEITIKGRVNLQALEIYFMDIGKYGAGDCGESTYIKYGDIDIIVDAGDNFTDSKKAINEVINKHLEDGIIDYVIATHPDGDHIGGMASLFDTYTIKNLIKFEGGYSTKKYENMERAFQEEKCNVYQIKSDIIDQNKQDRFIELSNDVYISFVNTKYYDNSESNGKSIVFTIYAYGKKVLMTGDADNATGHTDMEKNYQDSVGNIDILKVVHHGTANGTSSDFLKTVDPEVAIICNGNYLGNKHGHPTPTAIKNLYSYDANMKVYCITGGGTVDGVSNTKTLTYKCSSEDRFNQRNGTISLFIDNGGYTIESEYFNSNIIELKDTYYYKGIKDSGLFDLIK